MERVTEFFAMGGYAGYVWPAYAAAFLLLGGLLWTSLRGLRRTEQLLKEIEQRGPRRRTRGGDPQLRAAMSETVEP